VSCSELKVAARKVLGSPPISLVNICSRAQTLVEVLHAAALPKEHHSNGHDQAKLRHCHGLGALHAAALPYEHHSSGQDRQNLQHCLCLPVCLGQVGVQV